MGFGAHSGLRHGTVDQELLARNEYLAAENRILKAQLEGRLKLSDAERATLGEGSTIAAVCSRCQSQRNNEFATHTPAKVLNPAHARGW
jgi:hypothetical protein